MLYTVYKITNRINSRFYIGCHQTADLDDGYMGSGKLIRAAIKKHGAENFEKEILATFETADQMFDEEKNLISKLSPEYNIHEGGNGGWNYVNEQYFSVTTKQRSKMGDFDFFKNASIKGQERLKYLRENDQDWFNRYRKKLSDAHKANPSLGFKGKTHLSETKKRMSKSHVGKHDGELNSQYGTMWITNGQQSKKIKRVDEIPEGWYKGRRIKNGV